MRISFEKSRRSRSAGAKCLIFVAILSVVSTIIWAQTSFRITIIGDSTVCNYAASKYPQAGWGQVIGKLFKNGTVTINNAAIGGRSTRSFYEEGRWAGIVPTLQTGEYVFIQFGHNDRDYNKPERYTDTTKYKEYLRLYVKESRAKGAIPVLVSPMNMNAWNGSAVREVFCEGANNYRGAMINVANELNVPFIDLEKKSVALQKRMGATYCSKFIYLGLDPGEYPNFPDGSSDGTHFQEMGANFMAKFVCEGIKELQSNSDMAKLAAVLKPLYKVKVLSNKANVGMITESDNTFPQDVSITVKVRPNSGEVFQKWINDAGKAETTGKIFTFTMSGSDITCTALFQGGTQVFNLTSSVSSGEGTISPANGSFTANTKVTLTANAAEGFLFDHWGGDISGSDNPISLTMNSNKTIEAFFLPDNRIYYTINTLVSGNGSVTQMPQGGRLAEGAAVSFTAVPAAGWQFAGWAGDHTGTEDEYAVSSLDRNLSLTARFTPINKYLYEAENAVINGGVSESVNSGFSGTGYANVNNEAGSSIEIPVYVDNGGEKMVTLVYANGSAAARSFTVIVNGEEKIKSMVFETTGAWTTWEQKKVALTLIQGVNTIILRSNASDGGPNIDRLEIEGHTSIVNRHNSFGKPVIKIRPGRIDIYTSGSNSFIRAEIFSLDGQKVMELSAKTAENSRQTVFPLQNLKNGNYLLRITTGGLGVTKNIMYIRH